MVCLETKKDCIQFSAKFQFGFVIWGVSKNAIGNFEVMFSEYVGFTVIWRNCPQKQEDEEVMS